MNVSMNPNYIEDLNGSDYVCMTRSTPQSASKLAALNPVTMNTTNNHRASPTNNTTSSTNMPAPMQLTSKNLQTLQQEQLNASNRSQIAASDVDKASSTSPTPSQLSNNSNKRKINVFTRVF